MERKRFFKFTFTTLYFWVALAFFIGIFHGMYLHAPYLSVPAVPIAQLIPPGASANQTATIMQQNKAAQDEYQQVYSHYLEESKKISFYPIELIIVLIFSVLLGFVVSSIFYSRYKKKIKQSKVH